MAVAVITYVELKKAIRIALRSRLEAITRTRRPMASGHFSRTDTARKHERRRDGEKLEASRTIVLVQTRAEPKGKSAALGAE